MNRYKPNTPVRAHEQQDLTATALASSHRSECATSKLEDPQAGGDELWCDGQALFDALDDSSENSEPITVTDLTGELEEPNDWAEQMVSNPGDDGTIGSSVDQASQVVTAALSVGSDALSCAKETINNFMANEDSVNTSGFHHESPLNVVEVMSELTEAMAAKEMVSELRETVQDKDDNISRLSGRLKNAKQDMEMRDKIITDLTKRLHAAELAMVTKDKSIAELQTQICTTDSEDIIEKSEKRTGKNDGDEAGNEERRVEAYVQAVKSVGVSARRPISLLESLAETGCALTLQHSNPPIRFFT